MTHVAWLGRACLPVLAALLLLSACEEAPSAEPPATAEQAPTDGHEAEAGPMPVEPEPVPEVPPPAEATLVAIGDIMMHTPQLPGAYDKETDTYDFSSFFAPLKSLFTEADWAFANLETPIAGDDRGFRGYPLFNAPVALADALADAGFDVLSTANNHSLDQGFSGIEHTLETLRAKQLIPIGTAATEEASREIAYVEKNGITAGFLSYTYGTNGIPIPKDKPFAVNLIDEARIAADIEKAREGGADAVVVSLHFGQEYQREPSDEQRRVARGAIEAGADLIIGHHPHVVQPYEMYETTSPDGSKREGLIMYSLGNYISNQFGGYKEYGAVLKVAFRKTYQPDGTARTNIAEVDAIPTWVHKYVSGGKARYRVLSLDEVAKAESDPLLTQRLLADLSSKATEMNRHLDSLVTTADTPPAVPAVEPQDETKGVTRDVYR
ncbi:CapA family protein [Paenibacillus sp. TRM 82003]|nr:CapA family protein [Paenibacillus sp. TRM 82003]